MVLALALISLLVSVLVFVLVLVGRGAVEVLSLARQVFLPVLVLPMLIATVPGYSSSSLRPVPTPEI